MAHKRPIHQTWVKHTMKPCTQLYIGIALWPEYITAFWIPLPCTLMYILTVMTYTWTWVQSRSLVSILASNRYFSPTITPPPCSSVAGPNTLHQHSLDNCPQSRAYIGAQKSNFVLFLVNELKVFLGRCSNKVRHTPAWYDWLKWRDCPVSAFIGKADTSWTAGGAGESLIAFMRLKSLNYHNAPFLYRHL